VYVCDPHPHKRANAAVNIGAFAVFYLEKSPDEAFEPLGRLRPAYHPFRDAGYGPNVYQITVLDVLRGLFRGKREGWIDLETFDLQEYEHFEKVENGDLNWHVPGKFLAFSGPSGRKQIIQGYQTLTPEDYISYFKKKNVTCVVRLNKKIYDRRQFTDHGIRHVDLYFIDGGVPPPDILKKFLELAEGEKGALAVHCKAGLGRTGVLIGAYIMKHFGWTANEVMGYMRVCRPGSILGPQQNYLKDNEKAYEFLQSCILYALIACISIWRMGELYRRRKETESLAVESPRASSASSAIADVSSPQLRSPSGYRPVARPGAGAPGSVGSPASPSKGMPDALFEAKLRGLSLDSPGAQAGSGVKDRPKQGVQGSTFARSRFTTSPPRKPSGGSAQLRSPIRPVPASRYAPTGAGKMDADLRMQGRGASRYAGPPYLR